MGNTKHSQTAEFTAAIRARHFLYGEKPLILEDPIAIDLLNPELREICLDEDKGKVFGDGGSVAIVLGRARYTEDNLEKAVRSGTNQYVILGAGGDSFVLRRPDLVDKIRVYEVDQPGTQKWKQERLSEFGHALPASLEFISADFKHETVLEALDRSSFRKDQRVFISWLGVLMYLTPETIFGTLKDFAKALSPGSEIVFDYRVQIEFVDPDEVDFVLKGDEATATMGEPKNSFFNPDTFPDEIMATGFEMVENLSPKQLAQRYLTNRKDAMRPTSHHWYGHIRLS